MSHPFAGHQIGHHGVKQFLDGAEVPAGRPLDLFDQRVDDGIPAIFIDETFYDFWCAVGHGQNSSVPKQQRHYLTSNYYGGPE